jgi:SAM-dependent methyltransferase
METIHRFDNRAGDYVKYRPGYPARAIDIMLRGLGDPRSLTAADVGAGTGISARLLGERGVHVIAVEPGSAMRGAAEAHLNVDWLAGRADALGLASASIDIVVCAQSFHWFQTHAAVAEFARVLKPGGRLAIMWNRRSVTDPLTLGYRQAIYDVGGETAAERMGFDPAVVGQSRLFTPPERHAFPNTQRVTLDGLIGRARSASYVPKEGEAGERLVDLLRALHARYADAEGLVTIVYEAEVWLSSRL